MRCASIVFSILAVFSMGNAFSEDAIREGAVLEVGNQTVILRESPPVERFLFFVEGPGAEVQQLSTGQQLTVEEVKTISAPLRKDVWVKGRAEDGVVGWVYYGDEGESVNFENTERTE